MCGICGFNWENKEKINQMMISLNHRGPDDKGMFLDKGISLGHVRLSILDISKAGHQPMCDENEEIWIIFNGEIYNFEEVKKELGEKYKFKSKTDTETIIYAYKKWGVKCLDKFNGMFAFCIYDSKKKILFVARDRIGQKPLFFHHDIKTKKFIFGSEIKCILKNLGGYSLNRNFVKYLFTYNYIPSDVQVFEGINKFNAGHYMIFDMKNGKIKEYKKYWDINYDNKLSLSEKDAVKELKQKLQKAVEYTLVSDVPVGAFLSGGFDSSIMVYHAAKINPKIKTFSIGSTDKNFDESKYAKIVAEKFGTDHTTSFIESEEFLKTMKMMYNYYDIPFLSTSSVTLFILSEIARKKVKVSLSGEGGDENFAGYTKYLWFKRASRLYKMHKLVKKGMIYPPAKMFSKFLNPTIKAKVDTILSADNLEEHEKYGMISNYYDSKVVSKFIEKIDKTEIFKRYEQYFKNKSRIDNALNSDLHIYMESDLLYKLDISAMAKSLEGRTPYLDHTLVEWIAKLPESYKMNGSTTKYILKKAYNNILPKEIVKKPKRGFGLPFKEFMTKNAKDIMLAELNNNSEIFKQKLVKKENCMKAINNFGINNSSMEYIYKMFQLEMFLKSLPGKVE